MTAGSNPTESLEKSKWCSREGGALGNALKSRSGPCLHAKAGRSDYSAAAPRKIWQTMPSRNWKMMPP